MPYNSSTLTDPSSQIFEKSFRTKSTIMTFSDLSFALLSNLSLFRLSSITSKGFFSQVPFIGCESIRLPSRLRYLSGLAHIRYLSLILYNAEKGFGDTSVNKQYVLTTSTSKFSKKNSWQKLIS